MPCAAGSSPVRKVGHTAPLPIVDGDRTSSHLPSANNDLSDGSSSCSIISRTSVDSAASIPMASTLVLTEQLLRIDWSCLISGANTRFQDGHSLQIVSGAHLGLFTVKHRAFE